MARPKQIAPDGPWGIWLVRAGRGFGKTRLGAEWVREKIEQGCRRIALVSDTEADTRDVMVLGPSGVCNVGPPAERPKYKPSTRRVIWKNGAEAILYSANAPELLRGPEHDAAWADELAKWKNLRKVDAEGGTAWSNLQMGLRVGEHPQCLVTTTPRNIPAVKEILRNPRAVVTIGSSFENAGNLAPTFWDEIARYEGTTLGRQELLAEILDDVEGALWTMALIEAGRLPVVPRGAGGSPILQRIVVAIDPAASSGPTSDETGITAVGRGPAPNLVIAQQAPHGYVLADRSGRFTPGEWARRALDLCREVGADCLVAEGNNGGEMVQHTVRSALRPGEAMPRFKLVHASHGKAARAEPFVALYEQGRVHHVGGELGALEDQMCSWVPGESTKSPDRLDALVWALADLFPNQAIPRVARRKPEGW